MKPLKPPRLAPETRQYLMERKDTGEWEFWAGSYSVDWLITTAEYYAKHHGYECRVISPDGEVVWPELIKEGA